MNDLELIKQLMESSKIQAETIKDLNSSVKDLNDTCLSLARISEKLQERLERQERTIANIKKAFTLLIDALGSEDDKNSKIG